MWRTGRGRKVFRPCAQGALPLSYKDLRPRRESNPRHRLVMITRTNRPAPPDQPEEASASLVHYALIVNPRRI